MQMVARTSLLTAMCVAGLLGIAAVAPAGAVITNTITVAPGTNITTSPGAAVFTVTSTTIGTAPDPSSSFTSGLTLSGPDGALLAGWLAGPLPVYVGTDTTLVDNVTFNIPSGYAPGTVFNGNFSFTSISGNLAGGANQDFQIVIADIPEPGAIAFGVIAAGSVLGLVARKRKA